jgi:hypothetical protein
MGQRIVGKFGYPAGYRRFAVHESALSLASFTVQGFVEFFQLSFSHLHVFS